MKLMEVRPGIWLNSAGIIKIVLQETEHGWQFTFNLLGGTEEQSEVFFTKNEAKLWLKEKNFVSEKLLFA